MQSFGLKASKLLREKGGCLSISAAGNMTHASTASTQENVLEWVKQDKRRMLHVVYRVGDLDRTIKYKYLDVPYFACLVLFNCHGHLFSYPLFSLSVIVCRFYTECLGMKLLRKRDIPEERYTNAFLGYGPEDSHFVIELTYSKLLHIHITK